MINKRLSSCERPNQRIKHTHFTKTVKRHGFELVKFYDFTDTFLKSDLSNYIGELPPELRNIVPKERLSEITFKMCDMIDTLLVDKQYEFVRREIPKYELKEIGELFNTECVLETCELLPNHDIVYVEWGGVAGNVYKLSFPKLNVSYALKVFKFHTKLDDSKGHGAEFEIMTAFCANKSESKKNNSVYMAELFGAVPFMLSKWQNKTKRKSVHIKDLFIDAYENCPIYHTSYNEMREDNYINDKRIDWGETYKTKYGKLSYKGRKIFRQIRNMTIPEIKKLNSTMKNNFDKEDFEQALDVYCWFGDQKIKFR